MNSMGASKAVTKEHIDCPPRSRALIAVALSTAVLLSDLQPVRCARSQTQAEKAAGQHKNRQLDGPKPQVADAQVLQKKPADSLDGPPFVTARTWVIADGKTGAILCGHDEAKTVDIASTTKIMTAFVVLRLGGQRNWCARRDRDVYEASRRHGWLDCGREGRGAVAGARVALRAAFAIGKRRGCRHRRTLRRPRFKPADNKPRETDPFLRFIAEMNRIAVELRLKETHFANPNGLPADGHHSSARDLARLTHHALALPAFAAYVSTRRHASSLVDAQGARRDVVWNNTNRLLDTEGYDGVKTGTTRAAGECLVASGHRGDDHLIVVILGASSTEARYADARNLFRYGWLMRRELPGQNHSLK